MFDIYESVPFRIRSKSIGSERPRKRILETKVTRASSIECFTLEFLEKKLSPNNNSALSEINYYSVNDNDRQWKMRLRIHEDNRLSPEFHARDIKCPKIYQIDDLIKKHIEDKQIILNNRNKNLSDLKHKLHESTKKQLDTLDNETNNVISIIRKQKEVLEDKIKNVYKSQIDLLDNTKKTINQNLSHLSQILANTLRLIQKLESISNFN